MKIVYSFRRSLPLLILLFSLRLVCETESNTYSYHLDDYQAQIPSNDTHQSSFPKILYNFQGVLTEMLTVAYVRVGGIKNCQNNAYVIYGCPLRGLGRSQLLPILSPARVKPWQQIVVSKFKKKSSETCTSKYSKRNT